MPYAFQSYIRMKDPRLADALDDIHSQLQNLAAQTAANTSNASASPPPSITSLSVTASGGIFDIQIQDNSPVNRGITYFVEYSTTATFSQPVVVDLGASRNYRATWGNQTLYFRGYSQYPTSAPSPAVYFGTQQNPTAVVGGGAAAGPTPQASTGSGTASNTGLEGGSGYGRQPVRGQVLRGQFVPL